MKRLKCRLLIRRRLGLFFTLLTIAVFNYGYSQNLDDLSLEQKLALSDSIKLYDHDRFISILTDIESINDQLTPRQQARLKYLQAYKLAYDNKRQVAISLYKQVFDSTADAEVRIPALSSLIYNYGYLQEWENGLNYIDILIPQLSAIKNPSERVRAYESLINFYNKIGEFELAAQHLQSLMRLNLDEKQLCVANMLEVEALSGSGDLKNHLETVPERITLCEKVNVMIAASNIRLYLAEFLVSQGESEEAVQLLSDQLSTAENTNYAPLIASVYGGLAQAYLKQKNTEKAKFYALKIVNSLQFRQFSPPLIKAYDTLHKIASEEQDFESAYKYLKEFEKLNNIQLESEKRKNLAVQQAKNNAIQNANRISLLDKENTILKTQAELSKEQAENGRMALGLVSSFVLLMIVWIYRSRKNQLRLKKLAEIDGLTGVSNRYHFNRTVSQRLSHSEKHYEAVSFILFDLDHFKSINDNFGHQVGDWALQEAVLAARSVCREHDVIGRMGGEEFAILLCGCDMAKALQIAELCRLAIEKIDTIDSGYRYRISASFGVSDAKTCGYNVDKLFAGADAALYKSKNSGRNRVYQYHIDQLPINIT